MKKSVLIFYSNTGGGHLRAAQALKEEIEAINPDCFVTLYDGLEKVRFNINTKPSALYSVISLKFEQAYNLLYMLTNNRIGAGALKFLARRIVGRNLKKIIQNENPDLVISTHGLLSKSSIKKPYPAAPFITVITDLGKPHQVWFDKNSERVITPFPKKPDRTLALKTIYIDYPLSSKFTQSKTPDKKNNTILLLGGGTGSGNLDIQVKSLTGKINQKIIVVCGRNQQLFNSLTKYYKNNKQVEVHGFVENLPELYAKSDIVLTKAGPGTIAESASLGKPLIITGWVGLQEKENIKFVLENNLGVYEPNPEKLPEAVNSVYRNYKIFAKKKGLFGQGAKSVARYINSEFLS